MKKKLFLTILLVIALALAGCQINGTEGLVFVKQYDEFFDHSYISVSGGGKTDYTTVKVPESYDAAYIEVIETDAFLNCKLLVEINVPRYVTLISTRAFKNCESLPKITLSASLESIGAEAFSGCKSLAGITITDNVVDLNIQAFQNCTNLKNVVMPVFIEGAKNEDGTNRIFLSKINDRVFSGCYALEYMPLPGGIKTIGLSAFENCLSLKNVEFPDGLQYIESRAYYNCRAIEKIELPGEIIEVGANAFYGCDSLSEVVIHAKTDVDADDAEDGSETEDDEPFIRNGAFAACPIKKLMILRDEIINFAAFDFGGDLTGLDIRVLPEAYDDYLADPDWMTLAEYISVITPE